MSKHPVSMRQIRMCRASVDEKFHVGGTLHAPLSDVSRLLPDLTQWWTFGTGPDAKRIIPTGAFRTSDAEQMRIGVLEHLGIAQAPAWLFAAELREGTVLRLLTPFERRVPIFAVRPASRRVSTKVRIFIEHLEKTFALCSQFNPKPK
jgi:DNA-binding transcriptional LysR family regulator